MSWLFGMNKGQPGTGDIPGFPLPPPPPSGGDDGKGGGDGKIGDKSGYRFDSAALERAAQAAKELESSSKSHDLHHPD